jgi:cobalamin synthase
MNPRLIIFSVNLGLSFAILVLYIGSIDVISLVVVMLTASIVAASKEDLSELRTDKNFVYIMILSAIVSFLLAAYLSTPSDNILLYGLIILNIGLLLAYAIMRRFGSRSFRNENAFGR